MENETNHLGHQTGTYFLAQGQSIKRLHDLLGSNLLIHHLSKWLSVLLEISFYAAFAFLIIGAICIPTDLTAYVQLPLREVDPNVFDPNAFDVDVYNRDFSGLIYGVKFLMVLIGLPFLLFARLLARNRKKSNLMRTAFGEVEKMKRSFEEATRILRL